MKIELKQLLNKPTRITENSSNRSDLITYTRVIPCQIADHELLTMTVDIESSKGQSVIRTSRDVNQNINASPSTLLVSILTNMLKTV